MAEPRAGLHFPGAIAARLDARGLRYGDSDIEQQWDRDMGCGGGGRDLLGRRRPGFRDGHWRAGGLPRAWLRVARGLHGRLFRYDAVMTVQSVVCGVSVSSSRGYGRCNALQCMSVGEVAWMCSVIRMCLERSIVM